MPDFIISKNTLSEMSLNNVRHKV